MLKKVIVLITILAVLISCKKNQTTVPIRDSTIADNQRNTYNKTENALKFINGYVENANKTNKAVGLLEWVNSNALTTKKFKLELKNIIDEAYRQDPDLGLSADPIFDAQDNPSLGFEIESFDEKSNFLIVKGRDWPDFKLIIKISDENGEWLVDGCGIINIPENKRAHR